MRLRYGFLVVRNIFLREIEYRATYYLMFVSIGISFAADYLILKYSHSTNRQTYLASHEIMSFVVLGLFLRMSSVLWGDSITFEKEIRDGDFRRYLLQPIKFRQLFVFTAIGEKCITWPILIGGYVMLALFVGSERLVIPEWPFYIFFILALAITWSFYYLFVVFTFWLHETNFMMIAFNLAIGVFAGSIVPLDWLSPGLRNFLSYTPLPLLGDVPIRAALGKLPSTDILRYMLIGTGWLLALLLANSILYTRGVRKYESFGG